MVPDGGLILAQMSEWVLLEHKVLELDVYRYPLRTVELTVSCRCVKLG
jgi:hypothetical protein